MFLRVRGRESGVEHVESVEHVASDTHAELRTFLQHEDTLDWTSLRLKWTLKGLFDD